MLGDRIDLLPAGNEETMRSPGCDPTSSFPIARNTMSVPGYALLRCSRTEQTKSHEAAKSCWRGTRNFIVPHLQSRLGPVSSTSSQYTPREPGSFPSQRRSAMSASPILPQLVSFILSLLVGSIKLDVNSQQKRCRGRQAHAFPITGIRKHYGCMDHQSTKAARLSSLPSGCSPAHTAHGGHAQEQRLCSSASRAPWMD